MFDNKEDIILILGPSKCGKTSLLNGYDKIYYETYGYIFNEYSRNNIPLYIYDIGGRMKKYWKEWCQSEHRGIIYVFDGSISEKGLIEDLKELIAISGKSTPLMILQTKSDLYPKITFNFESIIGNRKYTFIETNVYKFNLNIINWFYDSEFKIEPVLFSISHAIIKEFYHENRKYKID